jgi:MPBQ/MSBQ methyltransferase
MGNRVPAKKSGDRALRFYHDILGLERLHYGLWEINDEFSMQGLKNAQERYENRLIEIIPKDVKDILDVGCGTGIMSKNLRHLGYHVEGLSPDEYQQKLFIENTGEIFHLSAFEDFTPSKKYDCIILSESVQYIPLSQLFTKAYGMLMENKYLLLSDYFVLNKTDDPMTKSGHQLDIFLTQSQRNNFKVIFDEDITDKVTKTLDLAKYTVERYLLGSANLFIEKYEQRNPRTIRLLKYVLRKKIAKLHQEMQLIDSHKFKQHKRYKIMLMQSQ